MIPSNRVVQQLRQVRHWHFNPFCTSSSECICWLTENFFEEGHAVVCPDESVWMSQGSGKDPVLIASGILSVPGGRDFFLNAAALGEAVNGISQRVMTQPQLSSFRGWDAELLQPGETFNTFFDVNRICAFASTQKTDSSYFDLVVYSKDSSIHFSRGQSAGFGLTHSGDVGSLLHYLKPVADFPLDTTLVIAVVGYGSKPLRNFEHQLPAICIPGDEKSNTLRVVPCPLDRATVGDCTLACLATVTRRGTLESSRLEWFVASLPATRESVNTQDFGNVQSQCYSEMVACAKASLNPKGGHLSGEKPAAKNASTTHVSVGCASDSDGEIVIFVEQNLGQKFSTSISDNCCWVEFGRSLRVLSACPDGSISFVEEKCTTLPCIAGPLTGSAVLAIGEGYYSEIKNICAKGLIQKTNSASLRIVHVTDRMLEQAARTSTVLVNALFILHVTEDALIKKMAENPIEEILNRVNISAVTALEGPLSAVVVQINDRRYFYRGVGYSSLWNGCQPTFGQDVTVETAHHVLISRFSVTLTATAATSVETIANFPPAFHPKSSDLVHFLWPAGESSTRPELQILPAESAVESILSAQTSSEFFDILLQYRREIELLLAQCQVCLSPSNLNSGVVAPLTKTISKIIKHELQTLQGDFNEAAGKSRNGKKNSTSSCRVDVLAVADASQALSHRRKQLTGKIQWLLDRLGGLLSVRGAGATRHHDLQRLERRSIIRNNVAEVHALSFNNLCDLIDEACHETNGCVIPHFHDEGLIAAIQAISASNFHKAVHTLPQMVYLCPRLLCLDPVTVGAIQETCKVNTALSSATSARLSLAMAGTNNAPALPLPILKRYVEMKNPGAIDWSTECNKPDVAKLRILLRGTISQCTATRDNCIPPQSHDLGWGIVHFLLETMEQLIAMLPCPAASCEGKESSTLTFKRQPSIAWDNTTCELLRGVCGFLLAVLASGEIPLSNAWKLILNCTEDVESTGVQASDSTLFEKIHPRGCAEWWVYVRLLKVLPFTGWNVTSTIPSVQKLVCRIIFENIVEPRVKAWEKKLQLRAEVSKPQTVKGSKAPPHKTESDRLPRSRWGLQQHLLEKEIPMLSFANSLLPACPRPKPIPESGDHQPAVVAPIRAKTKQCESMKLTPASCQEFEFLFSFALSDVHSAPVDSSCLLKKLHEGIKTCLKFWPHFHTCELQLMASLFSHSKAKDAKLSYSQEI